MINIKFFHNKVAGTLYMEKICLNLVIITLFNDVSKVLISIFKILHH
jgi:hypothetical protein